MKRLMVMAIASVLAFSFSITAEAKVYNYDITQENFPAADYAARYADVKAVYGDDAAALYNHYKFFGVEEGRIVKITKDVLESQANAESDVVAYKIFALDVLDTIVNDKMTDAQKVKAVEAWMKANITYGSCGDTRSYHITGPMTNQPTLEEGYAETFEFFMDALGIQAITNSDLKTNKVCVDGAWYSVDIPGGVLY
ncbi:hypothetical protein [Pseudobutyrivibrio xylanivorans]|uniref:Uncharacterized protein n=1 Tax=Pseudobutyrivibrio xylanivorans TaxID=185007 RepID=A0A1G5S078_PSEXY|nr:hypothetical protein [Pseudobutyrivibrio xylanivorans]SCZ79805.1 hypothetical protein SAMN02910350_01979 [Pseudobutyrivibrio xylanivorans]